MVIDKHNQGWAEYVDKLEKQNRDLVAALEKAPRPMPSLTAEELKANWKTVDHWFAVYDAWMEDVVTKALDIGKEE